MVREQGLIFPLVRPDADSISAFGRGYTVKEVASREGHEERGALACGDPLGGEFGTSGPLRRDRIVGGGLRVFSSILELVGLGGGYWVGKSPQEIYSPFR